MEHFIITEQPATIRMLAREALRGRWKFAFLGVFIYNLALTVPFSVLLWFFDDAMAFIPLVYMLLVAGPLTLGLSMFVLSLSRNQDPQIAQIFYGFERFGKSLGVFLIISLIVTLWSLIALPAVVLVAFTENLLLIPLIVVAMIPAVIAGIRYSQVFFILADHPDMGVMECVGRSKMLMTGNKMKYFVLQLTFIGWGILAGAPSGVAEAFFPVAESGSLLMVLFLSIVPGLGVVLLTVYIFTSTAIFYDMASGNLRPGCIVSTAEIVEVEQVPDMIQGSVEQDAGQNQESGGDDLAPENEQKNELQRDS